jgi:MFS family permease
MDNAIRPAAASIWAIAVPAAILLAITMGSRASFGLFVSPLNTATGLGVATISFAAALAQLAWGVSQPVCGALADRYGPARVIFCGGLLSAAASAFIPFVTSAAGLYAALAVAAAGATALGSPPTMLAVVAARVPAERRGFASGFVGAGGPAGQLVLAPAAQGAIVAAGWVSAMIGLAALSLAALPLSRAFRRRNGPAAPAPEAAPVPRTTPLGALRTGLASPSYWGVTAAFFVCGFHVTFLNTHMPGVIELCGLPGSVSGASLALMGLFNIAGSIAAGAAIQRVSMKLLLALLYGLRGVGIAVFLLAPKTETVVLGFSVWMGLTYMAALPPTAGLIGKLFGARNLGLLLGLTFFVHQFGAFLGAWLGGVVLEATGSFDLLWQADIALAAAAALIVLPIREGRRAAPAPRPIVAPVVAPVVATARA